MAKNRKIPFGYMMQNGEITTNPKEVLAVITIFSEYLKGKSLLEIAKQMDVPYSDGAVWNKNMVKRIIENEKYLGTDKYPQLIDEDTFHRANATRVAKATSLCVISDELIRSENSPSARNVVKGCSAEAAIQEVRNGTAEIRAAIRWIIV